MREHQQVGNWPVNSICDLTIMRDELRDAGYSDSEFIFVAHNKIIRELEPMIARTSDSYMDYVVSQGILYDIIIDNSLDETEGYLYATNKGMPITQNVDCLRVIPRDSFIKFKFIQNELEEVI